MITLFFIDNFFKLIYSILLIIFSNKQVYSSQNPVPSPVEKERGQIYIIKEMCPPI